MDHLEAQGASGSDLVGSSSTTIAGSSSPLGFYSQYRVQDDCTRATSSSHGQVENAAQSHTMTQGQDAVARQEVIRQRQQRKKERDRLRREADPATDDRAYARVCDLLAIKLDRKNTRSERSECLCIHHVGGIERYVVLKSVERIDQGFERVCELLEISMTQRKPLAHCGECLYIFAIFGVERLTFHSSRCH